MYNNIFKLNVLIDFKLFIPRTNLLINTNDMYEVGILIDNRNIVGF